MKTKYRLAVAAITWSTAACSANRPASNPSSPPTSARPNSTRVKGRLPPTLIQSIVRSHYPQIQTCYGLGLARDPRTEGKITMRFVIERDGSVRRVHVDDSAIRDDEVVRCIEAEFHRLSFPEPDGGIITVVYPLMLSPAEH